MRVYFLWFVLFAAIACGKKSNNEENNPPDPPASDPNAFKNPLLTSGPDPWIAQKEGYYYYTNTQGNKISIWKTQDISDLKSATAKTVWNAVPGTAYSNDVWAPELHFLQNKWYLYFTADSAGKDETHRLYVLENESPDPTAGTWTFKGKIQEASDRWAIDGSVIEYKDAVYLLWSGWEKEIGGKQNIYIAKMSDPWTLDGERVMISEPTETWERAGFPVNEGPEGLVNSSGRLFVTFSASFCGTDDYCLGMLSLKENGDPLNPGDWTKSSKPVLARNSSGQAFGPGHNGFFISPNGAENWIVYHANNFTNQGCGDNRNPRIQRFSWDGNGVPVFGSPLPLDSAISKPK